MAISEKVRAYRAITTRWYFIKELTRLKYSKSDDFRA
jgi:hypothetical protein